MASPSPIQTPPPANETTLFEDSPLNAVHGPLLPEDYFLIEYHNNGGPRAASIIPLSGSELTHLPSVKDGASTSIAILDAIARPWAPFRTEADFGYAKTAIQGRLDRKTVDAQLKGMTGDWCKPGHSRITMQSYNDMLESIKAARSYAVEVSQQM